MIKSKRTITSVWHNRVHKMDAPMMRVIQLTTGSSASSYGQDMLNPLKKQLHVLALVSAYLRDLGPHASSCVLECLLFQWTTYNGKGISFCFQRHVVKCQSMQSTVAQTKYSITSLLPFAFKLQLGSIQGSGSKRNTPTKHKICHIQ